ncbi:MAG: DUF190 domain-containing protein [Chlamydiae bacterium]|nr:DUF190 domain-containing protein [Chlamydiota bacterium]
MKTVCLRFYTEENKLHEGYLVYEYLLEKAKEFGLSGASVFKGIAGYGRHGKIHKESFFELGSDMPVEVVIITSNDLAIEFIRFLKEKKLNILFTQNEVSIAVID